MGHQLNGLWVVGVIKKKKKKKKKKKLNDSYFFYFISLLTWRSFRFAQCTSNEQTSPPPLIASIIQN